MASSPPSPFRIEPLQPSQIDDLLHIQWDAFTPPDKQMILPLAFPRGLQPDLRARLRARLLAKTGGPAALGAWCFAVRHLPTAQLVAVAHWSHTPSGIRTPGDETSAPEAPRIEGSNPELVRALARESAVGEADVTAAYGAHVTLELLAVRTEFQRRGLGSMLLRHGFERFDGWGLPYYLNSGPSGKGAYEKLGFVVRRKWELDCRDFGAGYEGPHWDMVREVRGPGA